jgi:hypothetical protein
VSSSGDGSLSCVVVCIVFLFLVHGNGGSLYLPKVTWIDYCAIDRNKGRDVGLSSVRYLWELSRIPVRAGICEIRTRTLVFDHQGYCFGLRASATHSFATWTFDELFQFCKPYLSCVLSFQLLLHDANTTPLRLSLKPNFPSLPLHLMRAFPFYDGLIGPVDLNQLLLTAA